MERKDRAEEKDRPEKAETQRGKEEQSHIATNADQSGSHSGSGTAAFRQIGPSDESLTESASSMPAKDENDTDDQDKRGSEQREPLPRTGSESPTCGLDAIAPGAVAVRGPQAPLSGDNEEDIAEVEMTSSAAVYMMHATPVEEIVATEVIAEGTADAPGRSTSQSREQLSTGDPFDEQESTARNGTREAMSAPVGLNVETVNFDELEGDEEIGLGNWAGKIVDEAPTRFESKKHHYVLVVVIVVVYLLITVFVIFGLAVDGDDNTNDDEDVCLATKARVLDNWQTLKGLALCAYIFASTLLFAMIFQWRRYELDEAEGGSKMLIPLLCSRASLLKQIDNRLTAFVYLLLHLFWFLFAVGMRVTYGRESLGEFWEDISADCPGLDEPDVRSLAGFTAIITVQISLLLLPMGVGIAQVFLFKAADESATAAVHRRRIRAMLQYWFVDLVSYALTTVSIFAFILPIIETLQDL